MLWYIISYIPILNCCAIIFENLTMNPTIGHNWWLITLVLIHKWCSYHKVKRLLLFFNNGNTLWKIVSWFQIFLSSWISGTETTCSVPNNSQQLSTFAETWLKFLWVCSNIELIGFCQNWFENHFLKFISLLMQSSVENWRSQSAAYPMQTFCSRRPSWSGWWPITLPVRWPRAEGGERATPNPHSPTCCWTQELVETCQRAAPISVPQSDGLIFSAPCSTWAKDAAQDLWSAKSSGRRSVNVDRILNIWAGGEGVIFLHFCFTAPSPSRPTPGRRPW